jgi:hypothetical protein
MNFEIAPKSTEIEANWDDARLYCFALNIEGKTGWRLPTKDELNQIYESNNDYEPIWYWSSTEGSGGTAWSQNFDNGAQASDNYKGFGVTYVRAIRSTV